MSHSLLLCVVFASCHSSTVLDWRASQEHTLDLEAHPCIGVASEGDKEVPIRRYSLSSPEMSYAIAKQVRPLWFDLLPPDEPSLSAMCSL